MSINCPCLNCEERVVGCHSNCESYKNFRTAMDDKNKSLRDSKHFEGLIYTPKENIPKYKKNKK